MQRRQRVPVSAPPTCQPDSFQYLATQLAGARCATNSAELLSVENLIRRRSADETTNSQQNRFCCCFGEDEKFLELARIADFRSSTDTAWHSRHREARINSCFKVRTSDSILEIISAACCLYLSNFTPAAVHFSSALVHSDTNKPFFRPSGLISLTPKETSMFPQTNRQSTVLF